MWTYRIILAALGLTMGMASQTLEVRGSLFHNTRAEEENRCGAVLNKREKVRKGVKQTE